MKHSDHSTNKSDTTNTKPVAKPTHDEVAKKTYSLCEKEGRPQGHDKQNWVAAEAEISCHGSDEPKGHGDHHPELPQVVYFDTAFHRKKASVVRVYLPPDALLSFWDHCLRSRHYVNLVITGKYQAPQWLTMDAAVKHCTAGIGVWEWAGNDAGAEPDVVGQDLPEIRNWKWGNLK